MIKVVDISHHQGAIDWDKMKSQGVDAVLMKCTQGTSFKDSQYLENKKQARAHGFLCGFYHFAGNLQSDGKTILLSNVESELDNFLKNVGDILPGEWVILDFEPKPLSSNSVSWCVDFISRLKNEVGYNPIYYTYESVLHSFDWSPVYKMDIGLWIAKYGVNDGKVPSEKPKISPWSFYALWQYTSRALGAQYGVSSKFIDLNIGEITRDVFKKYGKPSIDSINDKDSEKSYDVIYKDFFKKICKVLNFHDFGDNMNKKESKIIIEKVEKYIEELKNNDEEIADLKVKILNLESKLSISNESLESKSEQTVQSIDTSSSRQENRRVIAVIPPAEAKPTLTLIELLRKLFKFNK